jgi:Asp-tRNA(Asn)/Glu-tRNA(Gln) amidotransferase A subunit family amidase
VILIDPAEIEALGNAFITLYFAELWDADHHLAETDPNGLSAEVLEMIALGSAFAPLRDEARTEADRLTASFCQIFERVQLLAMPTIGILPPRLDDPLVGTESLTLALAQFTPLANVTGLPALSIPVPVAGGGFPSSLQLIGPHNGEDLLIATAHMVELAVAG